MGFFIEMLATAGAFSVTKTIHRYLRKLYPYCLPTNKKEFRSKFDPDCWVFISGNTDGIGKELTK